MKKHVKQIAMFFVILAVMILGLAVNGRETYAATPIGKNTVHVTHFGMQIKGRKPATASDMALYHFSGTAKYKIDSVAWYESDGSPMSSSVFEGGKTYYATIKFKAYDGYYFNTNDITVKLFAGNNGEGTALDIDNSKTFLTDKQSFGAEYYDTAMVIQTQNITVPNTYKAIFDFQMIGLSNIEDYDVEPGSVLDKPFVPNVPGLIFEGWYTDIDFHWTKKWDFNRPVTEDVTLYAYWLTPIPEVILKGIAEPVLGEDMCDKNDITVPAGAEYFIQNITWYANGIAKYGGGKFEAGKKYSAQIGIQANPGFGFPEILESYMTFSIGPAMEDSTYGSNYLDCTVWTATFSPKCRITFDANGGKGTMAQELKEYDSSYKLPANKFTAPAGKIFDKWDAGPAGSSITIKNHMTLKAIWKNKPVEEPKPAEPEPTETTEAAPLPPGTATPDSQISLKKVEKSIINNKKETDVKQSTYSLLKAKGTPLSNKTIKLTWSKVKGAKKYIIYGNKCGPTNKYEMITTVTGKSYSHKKLKKGTYYKFIVVAVKGKKTLAVSKTIHVATNGGKGKKGNPESVTLNRKSFSIKAGKTKTIKATVNSGELKAATHRKVAFETDNLNIIDLTVTKNKCKITAKNKGTCYLYAYAQNGVYKRIKITVK